MTAAPSPRPNRPAVATPRAIPGAVEQGWGGSGSGWPPAWSGPEPALANVQLMTTLGQLFSKGVKPEPFQAR